MCVCVLYMQVLESSEADAKVQVQVQIVLRLRVPDSHSDCPLGEKYGAAEEACSDLVRPKSRAVG